MRGCRLASLQARRVYIGPSSQNQRVAPKPVRATPSEELISALASAGCSSDIFRPSHGIDYSRVHPSREDKYTLKARIANARAKGNTLNIAWKDARLSYATIVARYVQHVHPLLESQPASNPHDEPSPALDSALLAVFNHDTVEYLASRGFSAEDVVRWSWILTSKNPEAAALRLLELTSNERESLGEKRPRLPFFVLAFLLRCQPASAYALQIFLRETYRLLLEDRIAPVQDPATAPNNAQANLRRQYDSAILLIVRLMRIARETWPAALVSIMQLFTSVFGADAIHQDSTEPLDERFQSQLTFVYNRCLSLLALPCSINPFHSVQIQQELQFRLLREMIKLRPALPVTREGYHAITRVQLAHSKTIEEQHYAILQSKSWPPWKEPRFGLDLETDEGSESRALRSIFHMTSAGYSLTQYDQAAKILSGWDTDGTPTIQSRAFTPGDSNVTSKLPDDESLVWAARIRATRTLKEAWANFLLYEDRHMPVSPHVNFAMCEKIVFFERASNDPTQSYTESLPGDKKEVSPEPSSPRDVIYVRKEPPSLDQFLQKMYSQKLYPSGRFLCFLLAYSKTLSSSTHSLLLESIPIRYKEGLLLKLPPEPYMTMTIEAIPKHLFTAFITFLCNLCIPGTTDTDLQHAPLRSWFPILFSVPSHATTNPFAYSAFREDAKIDRSMVLSHAITLMKLRNPRHAPSWHQILMTLLHVKIDPEIYRIPLATQRTMSWWEISEVLKWMSSQKLMIEVPALEIACSALGKVLTAMRVNPAGVERGVQIARSRSMSSTDNNISSSYPDSTPQMVLTGLDSIKRYFDNLMLPGSAAFSAHGSSIRAFSLGKEAPLYLPRMFRVPKPSLLHSLMRVLGMSGDIDGIIRLLSWMHRYESELCSAVNERAGGPRQMRYAVVAVRVFLEGYWDRPSGMVFSDLVTRSEQGNVGAETSEADVNGSLDLKNTEPEELDFSNAPIEHARRIIEATPLLSPWASDEEVLKYTSHLA